MQPRILLAFLVARAHCWLIFNTVSIRNSGSFTANLFSRWAVPSMYLCLGWFLPGCRTSHFPLLNYTGSLSAYFSSLLTFSRFCIISRLANGTLHLITRIINRDVHQNWTSTDPWGTPLVTGLQPDFVRHASRHGRVVLCNRDLRSTVSLTDCLNNMQQNQ